MVARDILIYLSLKYNGDWQYIYSAILLKQSVDVELAENTIKEYTEKYPDVKIITMVDDDYPEHLKLVLTPPFVIYKKDGNKIFETTPYKED